MDSYLKGVYYYSVPETLVEWAGEAICSCELTSKCISLIADRDMVTSNPKYVFSNLWNLKKSGVVPAQIMKELDSLLAKIKPDTK